MKTDTTRFVQVEIDKLTPSPLNPRQETGDIEELIESIRAVGVLEPLLGRAVNNRIEVIAGGRRLAAAKKAGLKQLPVVIRPMTDEEAVIVSVTENLHRGELDLKDRLRAYDSLKSLNAHKYSQPSAIAHALGVRPQRIADDYTAQEAMQRLKPGKVAVSTSRSESAGIEKRTAVLPFGHAVRLEQTMAPLEKSVSKPEFRKKYLEIAREIAPLPREKAERVLSLVEKHPTKSTQEIRKLSAALVERQLALPQETAERLEERAKALGKSGWEDAIESLLETPSAQTAGAKVTALVSATNGASVEMQWLNKLEWNMRQGLKASPEFYTIGLEGHTLASLIEAVKRFRIRTVVDIRTNPVSSPRSEFCKPNLSRSLDQAGVRYVHYPELSLPPERLAAASKERSRPEVWKWYTREVVPVLDRLMRSKIAIFKGQVAFLCEERDPTACQRHCIAEHIVGNGSQVYDI